VPRGALLAGVVVALLGAVAQPATAAPVVALTFDDGMTSEVVNAGILKALADAQVRSILSVAGKNTSIHLTDSSKCAHGARQGISSRTIPICIAVLTAPT
jgi:hypothetical protein